MEITRSVTELIGLALAEDAAGGDVTTAATIRGEGRGGGETMSRAVVRGKEPLVIAGIDVFEEVFRCCGGGVEFTEEKCDGDEIKAGDTILRVKGPTRVLLMGERTALNFLMRLSGIATLTSSVVKKLGKSGVKVVDTRKTTPGWRYLEKYAVRVGGGHNHRFSLTDGVLIKDNHITAAGGITGAVKSAREYVPHTLKIEVEVKNPEEIEEAINAGADVLLLDNMDRGKVEDAVKQISGRALIEVSGGVTPENIKNYDVDGVHFISMGYLTHGARSVDINMKIEVP
ncbi:MAG: carboxylating nicotinate-nucleotide diphosphorylase [Deltaproteobacteria bacterium]|uniref:Probable nicotinate-nucleotide pyrophosphorylase [carboxylating] n=1 Tax=Candidatus Zymogenus saltonus TaxID=2844893 RepID=A0A9D8KHK9_9DELT|nr:carboxylating nicotinate-nucleotide diphosphorylase [Candidatus Zymogenus saltonus]